MPSKQGVEGSNSSLPTTEKPSFYKTSKRLQANRTTRKIILATCLLFFVNLFSQTGCADLFFSEYGEGS